jgi:hypothetical protein
MRARLLAILLAASAAARGADRAFDQVVKGIEAHYGTSRMHIPLMGLASFALKVGQPGGTSGFKLAVFQDLDSSAENGGQADLDRLMDRVGSSLHPLIRVRSRRDGESTYIFTGDAGKSTTMLIATFQRREATVVEVKVNMDTLIETIATPETAGKAFGVKDAWWDR